MRVRVNRGLVHLREWSGVMALFLVLTGGVAYAANTVFSTDIVDGEVKEADVGTAAVRADEIGQGAVATDELKNDAVTTGKVLNGTLLGADVADNTLKGVDIDESTLSSIGGGGPAGGDLTGTYPNPLIRSNAVGGGKVANDSLTGLDIDESSLGAVPNASTLGGRSFTDFVQSDSDFLVASPLVKVETDGPPETVLETSRVEINTTGTPHQLNICTFESYSHPIPIVQYVGGSSVSTAASRDYDEIAGAFGSCVTMNIGAAANTNAGDFTIMVPGGVIWGSPWVQSFAEWDPDDYTLMGFGLGMSLP